jgi:hypothetical protein
LGKQPERTTSRLDSLSHNSKNEPRSSLSAEFTTNTEPTDHSTRRLKVESVDVSHNHIHTIDLQYLSFCPSLRELNLSNNQFDSINLDPLMNSSYLEKLDLSNNWIREMDLAPISNSSRLIYIDVSENPVSRCDLGFLASCPRVEEVSLGWTQLDAVDLSPLANCRMLKRLSLSNDQVERLDLKPLSYCVNLESLDLTGATFSADEVWHLFGLSSLRELTVSPRIGIEIFVPRLLKWPNGLHQNRERFVRKDAKSLLHRLGFSAFQQEIQGIYLGLSPLSQFYFRTGLLDSLGLGHLHGFDGNLLSVLETIDPSSSDEEVIDSLRSNLITAIASQIEDGGSTHFVDIQLAHSVPEFAKITPAILSSRRREVECISVAHIEEAFDTTSLWLTSYGHDMLEALKIGRRTDAQGIRMIRKQLKQVGIGLMTQEGDCGDQPCPQLSKGLEQYLLFLASSF